MAATDQVRRYKFTAVPGIFADHAAKYRADNTSKATTLPLLGLIDRDYGVEITQPADPREIKPWERLQAYVQYLNRESPAGTLYKVLFLTRHGFGFHNEAEARVGREAWRDHWSHLDGDGQVVWADSELNPAGIKQVTELGDVWLQAIRDGAMPLPETVYTSPLRRCLETTRLVLAGAFQYKGVPLKPIVKELLRERLTDHTCDRRSTRTWIAENYPDYDIEHSLTETDELWRSDRWESDEEHTARKQKVLDDIFSTDKNTFISLTIHSYALSAILDVVKSPMFRVREGTAVAMLVKAEEVGHAGL